MVNGNWEWTNFKIRIRRHPAGSTNWSNWQEWCEVQHDHPTTWTGDKWSWTVWDSTLLELPPDPAYPNDIKVICFFSRQGAKVSYRQDSGLGWPTWPDDYVFPRYPYGAARIITINKQTGIRTDAWPTTSSPPIIVCCNPDPVPTWIEGTWPGSVTGYKDPYPEVQTGMCNAVVLYDKILAVWENYDTHDRIRSVTSLDTTGRVWARKSSYGDVFESPKTDPQNNRRYSAGAPNLARLSDGRLVCTFTTDEDSTQAVWPQWDTHSNIKAVVSEDWGELWSGPVRVISQAPQRFASWSGLCRLRDDGLLCIFSDGLWDGDFQAVKCTRATLLDELPIEDNLDHLNLDETPYVWGLLGDWETTQTQDRGKVLRGTRVGARGAKAFRGETSWTNYRAETAVKLDSEGAYAGLCLRVWSQTSGGGSEYVCYRCYIDHQSGGSATWGFQVLHLVQESPPIWQYQSLGQPQALTGFVLNNWHTIAVEARGNTFDCYLDTTYHMTVTDTSNYYPSGAVGLRVTEGSASFDDVRVEPR